MLKKLLLLFLYLFYGAVLTAVILVVRFPEDAVLAKVTQRIEQAFPGFSCKISDVAYSYPFSIRLDSAVLTSSTDSGGMSFGNVLITAVPDQLFRRFLVQFELFGGTAAAAIALLPGNEELELRDITIADVDLSKVEYFPEGLERTISGKLDILGTYGARYDALTSGTFNGSVSLSDFQMALKRPILQSEVIDFSELAVNAKFKDNSFELSEGSGVGPLLDTTFNGTVRIGQQGQGGVLDIHGAISPKQDYLQNNPEMARSVALLRKKYRNSAIPYWLSGTFQQPIFQFGNSDQTGVRK